MFDLCMMFGMFIFIKILLAFSEVEMYVPQDSVKSQNDN